MIFSADWSGVRSRRVVCLATLTFVFLLLQALHAFRTPGPRLAGARAGGRVISRERGEGAAPCAMAAARSGSRGRAATSVKYAPAGKGNDEDKTEESS